MKNLPARITLYVLIILTANSCNPCFYAPNTQNVPLFKEKNEGIASMGMHIGSYSTGFEMQAAYSCTNHIALMGNYFHFGHRYENTDYFFYSDDGFFRGDYGEFGLGYFAAFDGDYVFEVYGGAGWGGIHNENTTDQTTLKSDVRYNRFFVQPAIGWAGKHINLAFSLRYCLLNYTDLDVINTQYPGDIPDLYALTDLNHNPSFLFEPALTFRAGGENIKFQTQFCYSANLGNPEAYDDPLSINMGIIFFIHGEKKVKDGDKAK
jgi:hypothetical protein